MNFNLLKASKLGKNQEIQQYLHLMKIQNLPLDINIIDNENGKSSVNIHFLLFWKIK